MRMRDRMSRLLTGTFCPPRGPVQGLNARPGAALGPEQDISRRVRKDRAARCDPFFASGKPYGIFDDSSIRARQGRLWRAAHHRPSRMAQSRHVHRSARIGHQSTQGQGVPADAPVYPADSVDKTRERQFYEACFRRSDGSFGDTRRPRTEPRALPSAILRVGWETAWLNPAARSRARQSRKSTAFVLTKQDVSRSLTGRLLSATWLRKIKMASEEISRRCPTVLT